MKLQIAVCDDDNVFLQLFQATLTQIAQKHRLIVFLRKFSCGSSLLYDCAENHVRFDIVFLDIDMPGENGKLVAAQLRKLDRTFLLVFVSSLTQEVFQIFEYDTAYFLPKLQLEEKLEHVLLHLLERREARQQAALHCVVRDENGRKQTMRFVVKDIVYLECVARDIFLHTTQQRFHVVSIGFEQLKHDLGGFGLVETHRTCVVNASHVFSIEAASIAMQNGSVLPLSRRKRQNIFSAMAAVLEDELQ